MLSSWHGIVSWYGTELECQEERCVNSVNSFAFSKVLIKKTHSLVLPRHPSEENVRRWCDFNARKTIPKFGHNINFQLISASAFITLSRQEIAKVDVDSDEVEKAFR